MWKYQKQMRFLKPYFANRSQESNLDNDNEEQSESTDMVKVEFKNVEAENSNMTENGSDNSDIEESETLTNSTIAENDILGNNTSRENQERLKIRSVPAFLSTSSTALKSRRFKKDDKPCTLTEFLQEREKRDHEKALENENFEETGKPIDDALYHFFMSMYQITKKLPVTYQHIVRNNVFQAVTMAEANCLQISDTASTIFSTISK